MNLIANPVPWPNGAQCAACFTLDMDAESLLLPRASAAGS